MSKAVPPGMYSITDAAIYIGVPRTYLYNMRTTGKGPEFEKGTRVYTLAALDVWKLGRDTKRKMLAERAAAGSKKLAARAKQLQRANAPLR